LCRADTEKFAIDTVHHFHRRVRVALILGYALFALAVGGLTAWLIVDERDDALARSRELTEVIARALEEQARANLSAIDLVLRDQVGRIEAAGGLGRIPAPALHERLQQQVQLAPQLRGVFVFGPDSVLYATQLQSPVPAIDGRNFEYISHHRDHDSGTFYIGEPISSPMTGLRLLPMTRRINRRDGSFGGVVGAVVNPDYFEKFYQSLALGEASSIGVFRTDGKVLMRFPALPSSEPRDVSASPLFVQGVNKRDTGFLIFRALLDGHVRLVSYRKLADLPLVVAVTLRQDLMLRAWRDALRVKAALAAAVLLFAGGLLLLTLRLIERSRRAATESEQRRAAATLSLIEAEERYRLLVESSPVGLLIHHHGVIEYANPQAAAIFGESAPAVLLGKHTPDYVHPDDHPGLSSSNGGPHRQQALPPRIFRVKRRDGGIALVESSSVSSLQGGRMLTQVVLRDITEERQAEQALRASEARFASIFAIIPVGIVLVDLDSGEAIQVNPAFEQLSGYSDAEWRGHKASDFGFWINRDDVRWRETLDTQGFAGPSDLRYRNRSGAEGYAQISSYVIEAGSGRKHISFVQDLTERKRAEQSLLYSETKFREVFENASDSMWIVNVAEDGRMSYEDCNQTYAETISSTVHEVRGRTPQELFSQGTADIIVARWTECVQSRRKVQVTSREGISHGNRYLSVYLLPLMDAAGRVHKIAGVARDFTEIKRAEDEIRVLNLGLEQKIRRRTADLEAAYHELEAFSYSVSHDLRAPARAVAGFSQILINEHADELGAESRRLLDRIAAAGGRMSELIDGLLVLTHVSRQELQRKRVDLSAMATAVLNELRELDPARRVEVGVQPGLFVEADPHMVRSLLQNLLGNAWKYSSRAAHAKIEFAAIDDDGQQVFFVRDNGAGFDMEYAQKLFGVFQRMHSDAEFEGTGIGLATVDRIVRRHGGRIRAEARPGEGASFYFTLSG
jgi:PAS domain S-box-containing protein